MWGSQRETRRSRGWAPLLLGLAISVAQIRLVATAWQDCGISGATGLTTGSLYLLGVPALTFLNWLLVALPAEVYLPKRGMLLNRWLLAIASTAILVAAETLVLGYYVATPTLPVGGVCVDNVPVWWPDQVPA